MKDTNQFLPIFLRFFVCHIFLIKIQEEISNELDLKIRKVTNKFNNILIDLKIIIEEIEKLNNNERF